MYCEFERALGVLFCVLRKPSSQYQVQGLQGLKALRL
jgi:hypothetical protein